MHAELAELHSYLWVKKNELDWQCIFMEKNLKIRSYSGESREIKFVCTARSKLWSHHYEISIYQ